MRQQTEVHHEGGYRAEERGAAAWNPDYGPDYGRRSRGDALRSQAYSSWQSQPYDGAIPWQAAYGAPIFGSQVPGFAGFPAHPAAFPSNQAWNQNLSDASAAAQCGWISNQPAYAVVNAPFVGAAPYAANTPAAWGAFPGAPQAFANVPNAPYANVPHANVPAYANAPAFLPPNAQTFFNGPIPSGPIGNPAMANAAFANPGLANSPFANPQQILYGAQPHFIPNANVPFGPASFVPNPQAAYLASTPVRYVDGPAAQFIAGPQFAHLAPSTFFAPSSMRGPAAIAPQTYASQTPYALHSTQFAPDAPATYPGAAPGYSARTVFPRPYSTRFESRLTNIAPKGYTRSDARIREDVCDAMMEDGSIDVSDVEVQVAAGEVTLTGTVADRRFKRALELMCESVLGVKEVRNNLRVQRWDETDDAMASSTRRSSQVSGTTGTTTTRTRT